MEPERTNGSGEDQRTVPVFGAVEPPPPPPSSASTERPTERPTETTQRPTEATRAQSSAPGRTEHATGRGGFATVLEPGAVLLDKYRVIEKLGEGGMGSVWLVQHMGLDERRALKVISEGIAGDPRIRARFDQEARILAKLKHPNAVAVHDTGIVGDSAYIEMEYVEGASLRRLLKRGEPSEPSFILWLMRGICDVLSTAHNRGIVHRDLKPENIMVVVDPESGRRGVKVLDFGIAKIIHNIGDAPAATLHTMGILGTPAYSSPEQNAVELDDSRRRPVDHRSDVYSLGVLLYELLTGELPFSGDWTQVLYQHARTAPVPPRQRAAGAAIPPAVERLTLQCLEKTPEQRPRSAAELYNSLRAAYGDAAGAELDTGHESQLKKSALPLLTPHPNATAPPARREAGPKPRPARRRLLVPLALAVVSAPAALLLWRGSEKEPPPPPPPPRPEGASPEVVDYLARHFDRRVYKPDPGAETVEIDGARWPSSIVRADVERPKLRLHDRVYLPEGSAPATSEGTEGALRLPRVVLDQTLSPKPPVAFRLIEGGDFEMGDDSPDLEGGSERPRHKVSLHTYYMQEKETTIGQFDQWCAATGRPPNAPELVEYRAAKGDLGMPIGEPLDDFPAVSLSRELCEAYARGLGGELPTEAQWEYAARSRGVRKKYVWDGDGFNRGDANILSLETTRGVRTHRVGDFPRDQTAQGVYDLAGNAREWCRDVWKPYSQGLARDPLVESTDSDPEYVIRGGSCETPQEMARVSYRTNTDQFEYQAANRESFPDVGFRVVLEVVVVEPLNSAPRSGPLAKKEPGE